MRTWNALLKKYSQKKNANISFRMSIDPPQTPAEKVSRSFFWSKRLAPNFAQKYLTFFSGWRVRKGCGLWVKSFSGHFVCKTRHLKWENTRGFTLENILWARSPIDWALPSQTCAQNFGHCLLGKRENFGFVTSMPVEREIFIIKNVKQNKFIFAGRYHNLAE